MSWPAAGAIEYASASSGRAACRRSWCSKGDAAGKGGAIRRVTGSLDARDYQVIPIAAPNDEERAHHYLWRFWRHLSRAGRLTIFDRRYGRVLVERVEGFATKRSICEVR